MKKILPLLALVALIGCTKEDLISSSDYSTPITYSVSEVEDTETRATLTTTANLASQFPTMVVAAVTDKNTDKYPVDFSTTFPTANPSKPEAQYYWNEVKDSYTFYSYPKDKISTWYAWNSMRFNYTVAKNATDTPDIVVAAQKVTRGNKVNLTYKHAFAAIEVYYNNLSFGHKITSITVKDVNLTGKCIVSTGSIKWEGLSNKGDIVDSEVYYATQNNTELNKDGSKFMVVPNQSATLEVVIDGKKTVSTTVTNLQAGQKYKYIIDDNLNLTQEKGSYCNAKVEGNKLIVDAYVTGEYITTTTTSSKSMDFILVLDYSGTMSNSYSPSSSAIKSYNKGVLSTNGYSYSDWKGGQNNYKYYWAGADQTIKCLVASGTTRYYAYFDYSSYRCYIGPDGSVYKTTDKTTPGKSDIYDMTGRKIPYTTSSSITYGSYGAITGGVLFKSKPKTTISVKTRIAALESSVFSFIDQVLADANASGVEHRISIIQFQGPRWPRFTSTQSDSKKYVLPEYPAYYMKPISPSNEDSNNKATTSVVSSFVDVNSSSVCWDLKDALSSTGYGGATAIDFGMYLAELQLKNCRTKDSKGKDVGKCVLVFTDGRPDHAGASIMSDHLLPAYNYKNGETLSKDNVAKRAVTIASTCKNTYKAEIFTVFAGTSSDKPDNSTMTGIATDASHYTDASSGNLSEAFDNVITSTTKGESDIDVHKEAFVQMQFSNAVKVSGSTYLGAYTLTQSGYNETTKAITFSTTHGGVSGINVSTNTSTGVITISGFDFGTYFCGKGANGKGMKLVMEFQLDKNTDLTGTGSNELLVYPSGLYKDADTPLYLVDSPNITL